MMADADFSEYATKENKFAVASRRSFRPNK